MTLLTDKDVTVGKKDADINAGNLLTVTSDKEVDKKNIINRDRQTSNKNITTEQWTKREIEKIRNKQE